MSPDFIQQLTQLFDGATPDKYDAYQNLKKYEAEIHQEWKRRFSRALNDYFKNDALPDNKGWSFTIVDNNPFDCIWYIEDLSIASVSVNIWYENFRLLANGNFFQVPVLESLLETTKYKPLICDGLGVSGSSGKDAFVHGERGQWQFGSPLDNRFTHGNELLWYAGNQTDAFVQQVVEKVNRFRCNPHLGNLLRELTLETKSSQ